MSETRLIHGFHAVTAKLRHAAEDIREITVAEGRQDGRMRELLKQAEARGVRVIATEAKRLDGMAGGSQHQGVVARVAAQHRERPRAGDRLTSRDGRAGVGGTMLDHEDNKAVLARQATERLPVSRTYLPTLFVNMVACKS